MMMLHHQSRKQGAGQWCEPHQKQECRSYGNYFPCPTCGYENLSHTWNSLDTCVPTSSSLCCTNLCKNRCIPQDRCDFQERVSRNIFEWKSAFDYGTTTTTDNGMNYGNQGAGCIYMGSISGISGETSCPFPWYPGA